MSMSKCKGKNGERNRGERFVPKKKRKETLPVTRRKSLGEERGGRGQRRIEGRTGLKSLSRRGFCTNSKRGKREKGREKKGRKNRKGEKGERKEEGRGKREGEGRGKKKDKRERRKREGGEEKKKPLFVRIEKGKAFLGSTFQKPQKKGKN